MLISGFLALNLKRLNAYATIRTDNVEMIQEKIATTRVLRNHLGKFKIVVSVNRLM